MSSIQTMKKRYSVRSYSGEKIASNTLTELDAQLKALSEKYGVKLAIIENNNNGKQFGTYGVIKNAPSYIVAVCDKTSTKLINAGVAIEKAILFCTEKGLGTCWLGGLFKRDELSTAITVGKDEVIPAIVAVGTPQNGKRFLDSFMRRVVSADKRKPHSDIFSSGEFGKPLAFDATFANEPLGVALEMVRIAPSGSNKQPWKIVKSENNIHFFVEHLPATTKLLGFSMQLLDIGIAISHFELAAAELGLIGEWRSVPHGIKNIPPNTEYIVSCVLEN